MSSARIASFPAPDAPATPVTWQALPPRFEPHAYTFACNLPAPIHIVWGWLNTPETFTKGQLWPYRVEFVSGDPARRAAGFAEGIQNAHHGPLMNFAGVLAQVRPPHYRDLQYYYGSYALSFRLIRPTRLQFWLAARPDGTTQLHGRVDSYVRRGIGPLWSGTQRLFWQSFRRWATREVRRQRPTS